MRYGRARADDWSCGKRLHIVARAPGSLASRSPTSLQRSPGADIVGGSADRAARFPVLRALDYRPTLCSFARWPFCGAGRSDSVLMRREIVGARRDGARAHRCDVGGPAISPRIVSDFTSHSLSRTRTLQWRVGGLFGDRSSGGDARNAGCRFRSVGDPGSQRHSRRRRAPLDDAVRPQSRVRRVRTKPRSMP